MKNVWILNHYAQEPSGTGGTRHFHLAEHLRNHCWQASIIAASMDHITGHQRLEIQEKQRLERIKGIQFLWVKTPEYAGNGGGRIFNMFLFTWRVLLWQTTDELLPPDVVIGSSVHPFAAVAGALLSRRFGVPFIFEVRDLWPQTLIDMGRLRDGSFMVWVMRKLERWLYSKAARIIVLPPLAWKYINPLGIEKKNIVWIPNGVDIALYPETFQEFEEQKDIFTLMYFGSHGQANELENLLQAMDLIQHMHGGNRVHLRLIGEGPHKASLMQMAREKGLKNVQFESSVPKNQIPVLATEADAFVISIPDLPNLYQYGVSPNKLFDYFAAARPIVIATSAANNPVDEACAGISAPPGQPQALAKAIVKMSSLSFSERQKMARAGREYVERNHSFAQLSARLALVLDEVCAENRSEIIHSGTHCT